MRPCCKSLHLKDVCTYIGFKTSFYVVRHLDSIASYLPTGLHLGFFRSWPSLYLPSSFKDSYDKSQRDALFLKFILVKNSTCFGQIYCPSSGISTLCTQCWDSWRWTVDLSETLCIQCWDAWWWTVDLSETCRFLYQNKFEKLCISLAFIIRIYHDARSSECQIP